MSLFSLILETVMLLVWDLVKVQSVIQALVQVEQGVIVISVLSSNSISQFYVNRNIWIYFIQLYIYVTIGIDLQRTVRQYINVYIYLLKFGSYRDFCYSKDIIYEYYQLIDQSDN
jgi:hypothetical protein